ncbi:DUF4282 domain-containing protein [Corynebacterium jeikeium]|uniref:DUF4282 domain-containing protein n=1 Tax=Corynebacterium jeikeium TaxID=38289 RepID=UPI00088A500F|nr:DUF4282 domain-containing protein [Corynebacterium jeikeium]SCX08366.1 hypothetical protein CJBVI_0619 [Corynebacterium jeikeium]
MTTPSNPYGSDDSGKHSADGAGYGAGDNGGLNNGFGPDQTQDYSQGFGQYGQDPYGQQGQYSQPGAYGQQDPFAQQNQPQGAADFQAYPNQQMANSTGADNDGFFSALFDFSFTRYVTPSVVKVLYILLMIVVGLFVLLGIIALLAAMAQDASAILLALIGIPLVLLGAVAWLAFYRVGLEVAVSIIRTAQSVQSIDERQARTSTNGS